MHIKEKGLKAAEAGQPRHAPAGAVSHDASQWLDGYDSYKALPREDDIEHEDPTRDESEDDSGEDNDGDGGLGLIEGVLLGSGDDSAAASETDGGFSGDGGDFGGGGADGSF